MAFVKVPGLPGKVYVPDRKKGCPCKHPCRDCFSCGFCSEDKCRICLGDKNKISKDRSAPRD